MIFKASFGNTNRKILPGIREKAELLHQTTTKRGRIQPETDRKYAWGIPVRSHEFQPSGCCRNQQLDLEEPREGADKGGKAWETLPFHRGFGELQRAGPGTLVQQIGVQLLCNSIKNNVMLAGNLCRFVKNHTFPPFCIKDTFGMYLRVSAWMTGDLHRHSEFVNL